MKKELNLDLFFAYKYKEGANHRVRGAAERRDAQGGVGAAGELLLGDEGVLRYARCCCGGSGR
jgi:hypothetical protein